MVIMFFLKVTADTNIKGGVRMKEITEDQYNKGFTLYNNRGATKTTAVLIHRNNFRIGTYKTRGGQIATVTRIEFDNGQYALKGSIAGSPKTWTTNGKHNIHSVNDVDDLVYE